MNKSTFTLGLGIGIIITSVILYAGTILFKPENKTVIETVYEELSDEQIIEKAKKIGMIFVKELPDTKENPSKEILSDEEIINKAMDLGLVYPETKEKKIVDNKENKIEEKIVDIPMGSNSTMVSTILFDNNIISNMEDFNNYINEKNMSTKIIAGKYELSSNMEYNEILNIITKKNISE